MEYDEALKTWGKLRLERVGFPEIDPDTVTVEMDFSEGWRYSSYTYEDARAEVSIQGYSKNRDYGYTSIAASDFDFGMVLREIIEAADGGVTSGKH